MSNFWMCCCTFADRGRVICLEVTPGGVGSGDGWEVKTEGMCMLRDLCQKSSESSLGKCLGNHLSTIWGCKVGCDAIFLSTLARSATKSLSTFDGGGTIGGEW